MNITDALDQDLLCPSSPQTLPSAYGVEGLDEAYLDACMEATELGAEDPFLEGALFLADALARRGDHSLSHHIKHAA